MISMRLRPPPMYQAPQDPEAIKAQRIEDELRTSTLAPPPVEPSPFISARPTRAAGNDMAALGLALGGQALSNQQQDDAIRRAAIADVGWQQSRKLGAPIYGIQAAAARNRMAGNEGMSYLAPLLDHYRRGGFR